MLYSYIVIDFPQDKDASIYVLGLVMIHRTWVWERKILLLIFDHVDSFICRHRPQVIYQSEPLRLINMCFCFGFVNTRQLDKSVWNASKCVCVTYAKICHGWSKSTMVFRVGEVTTAKFTIPPFLWHETSKHYKRFYSILCLGLRAISNWFTYYRTGPLVSFFGYWSRH